MRNWPKETDDQRVKNFTEGEFAFSLQTERKGENRFLREALLFVLVFCSIKLMEPKSELQDLGDG